jgi:1,2-diacylglycerol 3-alpha-glucosyltransferase
MKHYSVAMVAACPFPANYGTPGAIREMSETLAELGHDIHIVTYPFGEHLSVGTAKIWRVRSRRPIQDIYVGPSFRKLVLDFFLIFELCRVIRRERIDIIHAHNYEGALIGFVAKVLTGRPLVYNAVNLMVDELPTYGFLRPAFLAVALARLLDWIVTKIPDHIIAITEDLRDSFIARGIREGRVAFIPCGVNTILFNHASGDLLRARHQIGSRSVVIYTGVTSRFQRLDYLLQAFAVVLSDEPDAVLIVVSPLINDPDLPSNRKRADSLGISANVRWVQGHRLAELPNYLAMGSVAVLPRPKVPGHPIKLLNYMAAGKPIVCFAGGAKGLRHLRDAYIVPDHDWRELGRAIVVLLRDQELATRLGSAAKATVERDFDWRRLCRAVEDVYQAVGRTESERQRAIAGNSRTAVAKQRDKAAVSAEPVAYARQPDRVTPES